MLSVKLPVYAFNVTLIAQPGFNLLTSITVLESTALISVLTSISLCVVPLKSLRLSIE